eukprot:TRINITY_DN70396_c0_g1_i1.p1 TRINITY_DN70396_c0_g1~~TRINITY_DN70396_c0_g1_i1.p1  ORF type:complete len:206 (+),score=18.59 TRINITY_DN70396_c0_g1_i1:42-620(+)
MAAPDGPAVANNGVEDNNAEAGVLGNRDPTDGLGANEDDSQLSQIAVSKIRYDVRDFYSETGIYQKIARTDMFILFDCQVNIVGGVVLGVTSLIGAEHFAFTLLGNGFVAVFLANCLVVFLAFVRMKDMLRDRWAMFDICTLFTAVMYVWIDPLLETVVGIRKSKVLGIAQFVRVLKVLPLMRIVFPKAFDK